MRGKTLRKLKQNKAYTLMETLIVVTVMVILLGISIIGLNDMTVTMKMTELDNYAKTIYLEAQNQLAAKKVEGGMPKLAANFESYRVDNKLTVAPKDYPNATVDLGWQELYYVSQDDSYCVDIIPKDSFVNTEKGDYIIEFNPKTGVVYGVFYWENNETLNYDVISGSERNLESRTDIRVGYYGGIQSDLLGDSKMIDQKVEIINDEELYLKITYPQIEDVVLGFFPIDPEKDPVMKIRYEIRDKWNVWGKDIERESLVNNEDNKLDNIEFVIGDGVYEIYILLDSMQDGFGIEDLTASMVDEFGNTVDCNLNFNDSIEVTVYTSIDGNPEIAPEDTTVAINGLYANTTGKYVHSTNEEKDEIAKFLQGNTNGLIFAENSADKTFHVVDVEKLRHFRNLDDLNQYNAGMDIGENVIVRFVNEINFKTTNFKWRFTENASGEIEVDYLQDNTKARNPLSEFAPIRNTVFSDSQYIVYVEGNNTATKKTNVLRNFVVKSDSDNVGLWANTNKVSFSNVVLEDISVNGETCDQVGTLVGAMSDGSIVNSGVSLTTYYKKDGATIYYARESAEGYKNKMESRYDTYKVVGANNVGGLVGQMKDVNVSESYAAVKVVASGNNTGGFVGDASGKESKYAIIKSSYASGDVYGTSNVGGFIGKAAYLNVGNESALAGVEGAYATGNVYANSVFGGMVGYTTNSNYKHCTYYGMVHANGTGIMPSAVDGGGFVGNSAGGNTYDAANKTCTYLVQTGQNDNVKPLNNFVYPKEYNYYLGEVEQSLAANVTYPYSRNLINTAFPFGAHWKTQAQHYGNWKQQYVINNSLVYYEKYEDGTYGYYSMTYMAGNENQWLLDTLRNDKVIKEDGYALLSKYNLKYITYDLQVGSILPEDVEANADLAKYMQLNKRLDVTTDEKSLYQMNYEADIKFKSYKDGEVSEDVTFTVTGLYLYRLPYDLQCTDRYYVENFYDRFTIKAGYVESGNEDIPVIEDLTFFYCPHFAKTAFNPNINDEEDLGSYATLQKKNPEEVAVRSARQLNALGRNPYYWNYKGGATRLSFQQEVDIDFGTYTQKYCGKTFNLLAFDQDYSNQPIGQYNGSDYSSFANQYNGNYHKIVDYCVKSDNQYVGLFGEIYVDCDVDHDGVPDEDTDGNGTIDDWNSDGKVNADDSVIKAAYHQIQNVVMTVSGNNDGSSNYMKYPNNPEKQNNAGYIIGTFVDDASLSENARSRTGVGALIGSDYTIGASDDENATNIKAFTIYNCATTGYKVEYHVGEYVEKNGNQVVYHTGAVPTGKQTPLGIALGGLAGYSRGNIANCSATNDVKLVTYMPYVTKTDTGKKSWGRTIYEYGQKEAVLIGGFVGSYYYGTAKYCYSGGTIEVENNGKYVFRMRVGGFCPGWMDAPGLTESKSSEKVRYEHVYTYTDISDNIWNVKESEASNSASFQYLIPTVGRMAIDFKEVREGNIFSSLYGYSRWKWDTFVVEGDTQGVRVPGMSLYLDSTTGNDVNKTPSSSEVTDYFKQNGSALWGTYNGQTCEVADYDYLRDFDKIINVVKERNKNITIELNDADFTYTETGATNANKYPFPAFTFEKVMEGGEEVIKYNHYGEWPQN